jgi:DUF2975 family protein
VSPDEVMAGSGLDADSEKANRKLTQPLGGVVSGVLKLIAGTMALGLILIPWNHASFFGFGSRPACADVPINGLSGTGGGVLAHLRPGTYASTGSRVSVCANRPSLGQQALVTLTEAPTVFLYLAILLLLWQLLRTVRRDGPFAVLVAGRLRFLAWFILAGALVVTAGQAVARSVFASTIVTDSVPVAANAITDVLDGVLPPVLIACGLLTLARVIRVGAQMSDDLAGTV